MNKFTETNDVPDGWQLGQLSEFVSIGPKRELKRGTNSTYVSMSDVPPHTKKISNSIIREFTAGSKFQNGDTLLARITPCLENGKTAFVDILKDGEIGWGSTEFIVLSGKEGKTLSEFVYYLARSHAFREVAIKSMAGTSGRQRVQEAALGRAKVLIPSISEQKAIVKVLSDLDAKIELNRQMNKTLEEIGQALFQRWFVDFEFPNEDGKPYKSSGGKMIDSELGEIPKGWSIALLGENVSFTRGCSYTSKGLKYYTSALVTLKSIDRGGGFKADGFKSYVGEYKQKHLVYEGDIVVAHTDLTQNAEVLGKPAIVRAAPQFDTLVASMDLGIVRPSGKHISKPFIYYLLKSEVFQSHAYGYSSGTTVLHLSSKAIPNFPFVLPDRKVLLKFSTLLETVFKKSQKNFSEISSLENIRDLLLPRLMSGSIRTIEGST